MTHLEVSLPQTSDLDEQLDRSLEACQVLWVQAEEGSLVEARGSPDAGLSLWEIARSWFLHGGL